MGGSISDDAGEHSRSLEVEVKYDVDEETLLPDLSGLPGVAAIGHAEERDLDAQYFDTADLDLAKAGYALRRRSGGPDEGWHIKGPKEDGARLELHWPLADSIPEAVLTAAREVTDAGERGQLGIRHLPRCGQNRLGDAVGQAPVQLEAGAVFLRSLDVPALIRAA